MILISFRAASDGPESTNTHEQTDGEAGQGMPIQPEPKKMRFAFGLKNNSDKPSDAHCHHEPHKEQCHHGHDNSENFHLVKIPAPDE